MTNKYFAAILRPVPLAGEFPEETSLGKGQYYDQDISQKKPSGKENSTAKFYWTFYVPLISQVLTNYQTSLTK